MNILHISGNLTRDPELRHTTTGTPVANFTLAVDRRFSDKDGNSATDFFTCVAWNKAAETITRYMRKGSKMTVVGPHQSREIKTKDGEKKQIWEVTVEQFEFGGSGDYSSEDYPVVDDGDLPF